MSAATLTAQLGYLNSILSSYALKISSTQHREKGTQNRVYYYTIDILDNIDELVEYKLKHRQFEYSDKDNIFKLPDTDK